MSKSKITSMITEGPKASGHSPSASIGKVKSVKREKDVVTVTVEKEKPKKLTQKALADHLGCKQPYISKMKKKGMPMDSIESAEAWLMANCSEGFGHKSKGEKKSVAAKAQEQLAKSKPPELDDLSDIEGTDLDSAVRRAAETEIQAYNMLADTVKDAKQGNTYAISRIGPLMRNHSAAIKNRLEMQKYVREEKVRSGEYVSLDFAKNLLAQYLGPADSVFKNFPKTVGPKANPSDPGLAVRVIEDAMKTVLRTMAQSREELGLLDV